VRIRRAAIESKRDIASEFGGKLRNLGGRPRVNAEAVGYGDLSFLHWIARALWEWTRKCRRLASNPSCAFQRANDVNGDGRYREGTREEQCALEARFGEVIDREERQIDGEPDQRFAKQVTRAHANAVRYRRGQRPTSDNMVGWKAARSLRLGRNSFKSVATERLTPRMVQRAVLLPTFSTAIFFERIGFGRVPAVGVCDGGRSTEICLRLIA
jgi:hypothetical protein